MEIYILSDKQKEVINESQAQYKNGQFLTEEEANKVIDEWIEEYNN